MVVPPKHPKMIIFSRKTMVVGYHQFRKPPVWKTKQLGSTCFVLSKFKYSQALNLEIKPSFGPGGFPICNVKLPALGRCNQKFSRVGWSSRLNKHSNCVILYHCKVQQEKRQWYIKILILSSWCFQQSWINVKYFQWNWINPLSKQNPCSYHHWWPT